MDSFTAHARKPAGPTMEDDDSDTEIFVVDGSPARDECVETARLSGRTAFLKREQLVLKEQEQDEQLKELGLYEDGMTKDQKEELLRVVAMSRETAQEEEKLRRHTKDWESMLIDRPGNSSPEIDVSGLSDGEDNLNKMHVCGNDTEMPPHLEAEKEQVVAVSDSDDDTQPLGSQDIFDSSPPEIATSPTGNPGSSLKTCSRTEEMQDELVWRHPVTRRWSRRLQNARRCKKTAHIAPLQGGPNSAPAEGNGAGSQSSQSLLEEEPVMNKNLTVWPSTDCSCGMTLSHTKGTDFQPSEIVPYFCPLDCKPNAYAAVIVKSMDNYFRRLYEIQRCSLLQLPWGEAVRVGCHQMDSLDTYRRGKRAWLEDDSVMLVSHVLKRSKNGTCEPDKEDSHLPDLATWDSEPQEEPHAAATQHPPFATESDSSSQESNGNTASVVAGNTIPANCSDSKVIERNSESEAESEDVQHAQQQRLCMTGRNRKHGAGVPGKQKKAQNFLSSVAVGGQDALARTGKEDGCPILPSPTESTVPRCKDSAVLVPCVNGSLMENTIAQDSSPVQEENNCGAATRTSEHTLFGIECTPSDSQISVIPESPPHPPPQQSSCKSSTNMLCSYEEALVVDPSQNESEVFPNDEQLVVHKDRRRMPRTYSKRDQSATTGSSMMIGNKP